MGPIGKSNALSIPQSVRDMTSLLELIQNPEKYDKHVKEIVAVTDAANKAIDKLTKVKDVDKLISNANKKYADANEKLEQAEEDAAKIINSASDQAEDLISKAKAESENMIQKAKELLHEASAEKVMSVEMKRDAESAMNAARTFSNELNERGEAMAKAEAEIERKKALLAAL